MLKKLLVLLSVGAMSACTIDQSEFTIISSKPLNLQHHQYVIGKNVEGSDKKPVILMLGVPVHFGNPQPRVAIDNALREDKCGVALTKATLKWVDHSFGFGTWGYIVNGNLLLDKQKAGCSEL